MDKQSETIIGQIEASANGQEPKGPQEFPPALLVRARALLQAAQSVQSELNSLLVGYFYGAGIDPVTAHIQHDLQAGTYTLLDGPPER